MPDRSSKKRPEDDVDDPNVTAFNVVQQATEECATGPERLADLIQEIKDGLDAGETLESLGEKFWPRIQDLTRGSAAAEMGRRGGKKGGKARAKKLTKERRSEIARNAAAARWKAKDDNQ